MRWRSGDGSMLEHPGELVMEGSEEKWKFMRVVRGSIPSLSWVMDTNFFISPSLIIKHGSPAAAQYFWYYCKYSPQMRRKTRSTNNWADLRLNSKKNMTIRQKNQMHLVVVAPTDIRLGGYKSPYISCFDLEWPFWLMFSLEKPFHHHIVSIISYICWSTDKRDTSGINHRQARLQGYSF